MEDLPLGFTNNQHVDKIQSNLIFDLSIFHKINKNVSLNSKIINLLNNKYIVSNVDCCFSCLINSLQDQQSSFWNIFRH